MWAVVALLGLVVVGVGLLGLVRPASLIGLASSLWQSRSGLYTAVGLRVVLGIALLETAASSAFPSTLRVLGVLSLAAAVAIPVMGLERLRRFVDWWVARPVGFIRVWAFVATVFGGFLVYAVW